MDEALRFSQSSTESVPAVRLLDLPPSSLYREKLSAANGPAQRILGLSGGHPHAPGDARPKGKPLWRSCTADSLSTKLLPPYGRSCWTKRQILVLDSNHVPAFWTQTSGLLESQRFVASALAIRSQSLLKPERLLANRCPRPMLVVGHHQAEGARQTSGAITYLYADPGHLQPLLCLGWMVATQESSRLAKVFDRPELLQAGQMRSGWSHPACRSLASSMSLQSTRPCYWPISAQSPSSHSRPRCL